ncbi:PP2C family protein-serine/threonine phosphatase [Kineococcus rubinsiae]|uniref:PP2C family protein-serine/threonine phosphatase n=1 Tax=Kineococcus rubinsiae TaxID=2609562 RepID=UPI0014319373|nr:PP2C family protein-serine/threonine phosphatase [Kineococcus rubinsiae]NIZ92430.1 SpoIIE family protein phosphatase [Kineococcus rubinsiae]
MPGSSPFDGAGSLREAYQAVDWVSTSLGDPQGWPTALRRALRLALTTRFAVLITWGPEHVMLYNEAYAPLIGAKHPALGRRAADVFPEAWDDLGPLFDGVVAGTGATWSEDQLLLLDRHGFAEETYWTFSFSPLTDDDGVIRGVLDIVDETTRQVVDRRRLELLARLGELTSDLENSADLPARAVEVLLTAPLDLPAVDVRLPGADGGEHLPGPLATLGTHEVLVGDTPDGRLAWLRLPGAHPGASGVLTVALSEHLAPDGTYLEFLRLVAAALGNALSVAASYEAERRRADLQEVQAARLRSLVDVAQALPDAADEAGVLDVLTRETAALLHSDAVALGLLVPDEEGLERRLRLFGHDLDQVGDAVARALRGAASYEDVPSGGSVAVLPLRTADTVTGALGVSWRRARDFPAEDRDLLQVLAASTAQALDRIRASRAERQAAEAVRSLAETLQRSLLTAAPQPEELQIAVRYLPAAEHAQVGGDWYDAFLTSAGATCVAIGDVTGHDQEAAAAMGQVRNLLRGIGYSLEVSPASALTSLDRAMRDLGVGALATAVLATVERIEGTQTWRMRWTNAGHPPPLVVAGGQAHLLTTEPDLLLGLEADFPRADHVHGLPPGAIVVLYTDGLVERRGESVEEGLQWLVEATTGMGDLTPDEVCDALLALVDGHTDDDVALLALRVRPVVGPAGA